MGESGEKPRRGPPGRAVRAAVRARGPSHPVYDMMWLMADRARVSRRGVTQASAPRALPSDSALVSEPRLARLRTAGSIRNARLPSVLSHGGLLLPPRLFAAIFYTFFAFFFFRKFIFYLFILFLFNFFGFGFGFFFFLSFVVKPSDS